jgi:hypothetical protein
MLVVVLVVLSLAFFELTLKAAMFSLATIFFFLPVVFAFVAGGAFSLRHKILGVLLVAAGCLTIYLYLRPHERPNFGPPQDIASTFAGAEYSFKRMWSIGWPSVFVAATLGSAIEFFRRRNKSLDH